MSTIFQTKQTLYIIRHGTAQHNIPEFVNGSSQPPNTRNPKFTDSRLVPQGHSQAHKAGELLRSVLDGQLDGIMSSPLTRCLETIDVIAEKLNFGGKWVVREELREAYGIHFSDKRSNRSTLEAQWPNVYFGELTELDEAWKPDSRENLQNVQDRIDIFLQWLSWNQLVQSSDKPGGENSASTLLIASHGVWMECLFRMHYPSILEGGKRVYNCDIFRAVLECKWEKIDGEWKCTQLYMSHVNLVHGRDG